MELFSIRIQRTFQLVSTIGKVAGGKPPYFNTQFNMCKFIDKDIPANSLAVGNPCRVIRKINQM